MSITWTPELVVGAVGAGLSAIGLLAMLLRDPTKDGERTTNPETRTEGRRLVATPPVKPERSKLTQAGREYRDGHKPKGTNPSKGSTIAAFNELMEQEGPGFTTGRETTTTDAATEKPYLAKAAEVYRLLTVQNRRDVASVPRSEAYERLERDPHWKVKTASSSSWLNVIELARRQGATIIRVRRGEDVISAHWIRESEVLEWERRFK